MFSGTALVMPSTAGAAVAAAMRQVGSCTVASGCWEPQAAWRSLRSGGRLRLLHRGCGRTGGARSSTWMLPAGSPRTLRSASWVGPSAVATAGPGSPLLAGWSRAPVLLPARRLPPPGRLRCSRSTASSSPTARRSRRCGIASAGRPSPWSRASACRAGCCWPRRLLGTPRQGVLGCGATARLKRPGWRVTHRPGTRATARRTR